MKDEIEYGLKLTYKYGEKDTKWYADERQRDMALIAHKGQPSIKTAKPVQRKKK